MRSSLKMTSVAGATLALATALAFAPSLPAGAQLAAGTDGASPTAQLTLGSDGFFYSVTPLGGADGEGTLFRFDPHGNGNTVILHNFTGEHGDGSNPSGALIEDEKGNFYGVASDGGKNYGGTIFMLTKDGRYFTLYSFPGNSDEVPGPGPTLAEYAPGKFAGVSLYYRAIFTFTVDADATPKPVITDGPNIHYDPKVLGSGEPISVVAGPNGLVYGATFFGGSSSYGSLFSFDPVSGVIHTLHDFAPPEGLLPEGPLLYSDGILYGTTLFGGVHGDGTIFSYDTEGEFHTLYQFNDHTNGGYPLGGLAFGTDGDLYTTANSGGKNGFGTVLDFTGGDDSPNHHFSFNPMGNPGDGSGPEGGLTLGDDGVFYGMTGGGGKYGYGTIYSIDQTTLHHVILHSFGKPLAK